jgi:hypothetical protein
VRLDSGGNVSWQKKYGQSGEDNLMGVVNSLDGTFLALGYTTVSGSERYEAWILKFDGEGTVLWQKRLVGTEEGLLRSAVLASEGSYIAVGETRANGTAYGDGWIVKFDDSGSIIWQERLGGAGSDSFKSIIRTAEGNFVAVGTIKANSLDQDAWAVKFDTEGTLAWQEKIDIGPCDSLNSLAQVAEGNYAVCGSESSDRAWIAELGANGAAKSLSRLDSPREESLNFIVSTQDEGAIAVGSAPRSSASGSDGWMLKLNPDLTAAGLAGDPLPVAVSDTSFSATLTQAVASDTAATPAATSAIAVDVSASKDSGGILAEDL